MKSPFLVVQESAAGVDLPESEPMDMRIIASGYPRSPCGRDVLDPGVYGFCWERVEGGNGLGWLCGKDKDKGGEQGDDAHQRQGRVAPGAFDEATGDERADGEPAAYEQIGKVARPAGAVQVRERRQ